MYLLSISQLGKSLLGWVLGKTAKVTHAPFLLWGIGGAIALQLLFSQWSPMNTLFETAPLTWQQGLICLLPMVPMVPFAAWVNRVAP